MTIQETLDSLQPYVIGIRYLEGTALVDVVFKDDWNVPSDDNIKKVKGNDDLNYYMLFSEVNGIGLDDLLDYVSKTIKINLDREKKQDLLRLKVNELKEIFKKHDLTQLESLVFGFNEETVDEYYLGDDDEEPTIEEPMFDDVTPKEVIINEPISEEAITVNQYLDKDGNPIELTEDEIEQLAEEARAERNLRVIGSMKKNTNDKKIVSETIPKIKELVVEKNETTDCFCGPDEACGKCINTKDF